jgi:hypothetical protein
LTLCVSAWNGKTTVSASISSTKTYGKCFRHCDCWGCSGCWRKGGGRAYREATFWRCNCLMAGLVRDGRTEARGMLRRRKIGREGRV